MNEKLSFQHIVDALSQKAGVSKKAAETFTKSFFDTITEALCAGEDTVKIKGLGTFKLVEVESRESVNVSNGERIVIPGYKKVSFVPEDAVVEKLSRPSVAQQPMIEVEAAPADEMPLPPSFETQIQVSAPVQVELPQNEFSGIDLLISTPESMEEVRLQCEEAKAKMNAAIEEVRKANAEVLRLEKLLQRLETNEQPESMEEAAPSADEAEEPQEEKAPDNAAADPVEEVQPPTAQQPQEEQNTETFQRYINGSEEEKAMQEAAQPAAPKKKKYTWLWVILIATMLLAAIAYLMYRTSQSIDSVKNVPMEELPQMVEQNTEKQIQQEAEPQHTPSDSPAESTETKPETQPAEPQTPQRPSTYTMKKGESLTLISQRFYGTKDSVAAIIRANTFADPNNVPIGAVITLP